MFLQTPSFWDFWAGGSMELLRITENTFVVIDVNEERYYQPLMKEKEEKEKPVKYLVTGYTKANPNDYKSAEFTVPGTADSHDIYKAAYDALPVEYTHYMSWGIKE